MRKSGDDIGVMFPRLIGRGPIEAAWLDFIAASRIVFPRLIGRGPIEALWPSPPYTQAQPVSTSDWTWPH